MQSETDDKITRMLTREFPRWDSPSIERVVDGGSTQVHRVRTAEAIYYVRDLADYDGETFISEALVHQTLRSRDVRVPDVLYVARRDPDLGRSIMVTTEVAGSPLGHGKPPESIRTILREAGRDLAEINRLPVEGFGWVEDELNAQGELQAEFPTYSAWIDHHFGDCTNLLVATRVLTADEAQATEDVIRVEAGRADFPQAYLAHGDFDATHIYHVDGTYSGIIDFGEIRGAPALYDLAHFQIENGELLPYLIEGYEQVTALPSDYRRTLSFFSLLIALRRLSRHAQTGRKPLPPDLTAIRRSLQALEG